MGPRLVRKQDVAREGELEPKGIFLKYVLNCGGAMKKLMKLKRITDGGLELGPQPPEAMGNCLKVL